MDRESPSPDPAPEALPVPVVRSVPTPSGKTERPDLDREQRLALHARVGKGVNPLVYWTVRAVLQPFFHAYFRLARIGREHVPATGPVIFAANHRSFLDPFVIGAMSRRPVYFVAKKELFRKPLQRWFLNSLGAFPIDRGNADTDAMSTARAVLERGDCVAIFPEGTRTRPGGLGRPKRGVGRLALETGAPVVPIAVHGTTHIRTKWRVRPHKVIVRAGRPLTFPHVQDPTSELSGAVTARIWPCIELGWNSLGGHTTERGIGVDPALLRPELAPHGLVPTLALPAAAGADLDREAGAV
ncbi:MAG: 1-acyl-sn-glycerol-3-phosphate acyltransferase [Solirubrobacterales bacterium]|nr:1-acyl-sn-glycerol-3-phosphate acyltransferase [Solirubrobacterales bacterium]